MNKLDTRNPNIRTKGKLFIGLYKICHVIKILVIPNAKNIYLKYISLCPNVRISCIHFANRMSNEENIFSQTSHNSKRCDWTKTFILYLQYICMNVYL